MPHNNHIWLLVLWHYGSRYVCRLGICMTINVCVSAYGPVCRAHIRTHTSVPISAHGQRPMQRLVNANCLRFHSKCAVKRMNSSKTMYWKWCGHYLSLWRNFEECETANGSDDARTQRCLVELIELSNGPSIGVSVQSCWNSEHAEHSEWLFRMPKMPFNTSLQWSHCIKSLEN